MDEEPNPAGPQRPIQPGTSPGLDTRPAAWRMSFPPRNRMLKASRTSSRFLVIKMTAIQPRPECRPAPRSGLARALRRAARAIRDCHNQQVHMWECFYLSNRTLAPDTGPLRWALTLDGYRLAGNYLPGTATQGGAGTRR